MAVLNTGNKPSSNISGDYSFSTEEQVVGTWIDGKPIYRKVFKGTMPLVNKSATIEDLTNYYISDIVKIEGTMKSSDYCIIPFYYESSGEFISLFISGQNQIVVTNTVTGYENNPVTIILEYTKTTD